MKDRFNIYSTRFYLIVIIICLSTFIKAQDLRTYKVIEVNDTFLTYYHLIKVRDCSGNDTLNILNVISRKNKDVDTTDLEKICIGNKYLLDLKPVSEIMENYQGSDSVMLNISRMRSIVIHGVLFIAPDGVTHPFKAKQFSDNYFMTKKE